MNHTNPAFLPHPQTPDSAKKTLFFGDREISPYAKRLFDYVWRIKAHEHDLPILSYDTLHRTVIVHLQNELAKIKGKAFHNIEIGTTELELAPILLRNYSELSISIFRAVSVLALLTIYVTSDRSA
jgi:hypothetical protein